MKGLKILSDEWITVKISSTKLQQDAGRSGWLTDQPEGEGFMLDAHNAPVKGAPKVLLSIFVTDD